MMLAGSRRSGQQGEVCFLNRLCKAGFIAEGRTHHAVAQAGPQRGKRPKIGGVAHGQFYVALSRIRQPILEVEGFQQGGAEAPQGWPGPQRQDGYAHP